MDAGDVLAICDKVKGRGASQMALFARNVVKRMYEYAISRQAATINPGQQLVACYIAANWSLQVKHRQQFAFPNVALAIQTRQKLNKNHVTFWLYGFLKLFVERAQESQPCIKGIFLLDFTFASWSLPVRRHDDPSGQIPQEIEET